MIQQETLRHDQDSADLQATHALLEAQAESLVHSWHFSQKPFGKAAAHHYWQVVKNQKFTYLCTRHHLPDLTEPGKFGNTKIV